MTISKEIPVEHEQENYAESSSRFEKEEIENLRLLVKFVDKTFKNIHAVIPFAKPDEKLEAAMRWAQEIIGETHE